jgi:lipopolysaccharide kinase (Kdo/WaaP) family protein
LNPAATQAIVREGWQLNLAAGGLTPELREAVVARAVAAARGELGAPRRRSRHASTWQVRIGAGAVEVEIFIKLIDAPLGFAAIKHRLRGGRASHVARVTQRLNDSGFLAPPLLLYGREAASGREMIVTPRAEGDGPLRTLKALQAGAAGTIVRKRVVLRALGAEIARLHRCGFVHGDLTPFNILFVWAEPPRFVLIDHERTRRTGPIGRRRRALRNLVQLGRFDLPGLSATDRMRILASYTAMLERRDRRKLTRRVSAMLARRIRRDSVGRGELPAGPGAVT